MRGHQQFTQRPTAFPNHTQLPWKQKQEMAEQLCPCCLWGTDSGQLPLHMAIISPRAGSGQSWPGDSTSKATGQRLHTLPAPSCTDTASQEQGGGCTEEQAHPQLLWSTNTKMLYITSKQILYVLNVKHKYSDLGILIIFLYFNMTRFLRFTHNSAYLWVWRQLQYPYNTQP